MKIDTDPIGPPCGLRTTVDPEEIKRFTALAEEWWNPNGRFRPVHRFNSIRLTCIETWIARRFGRDLTETVPLNGLRILDVGCGAGLVAEPLVRRGASVVGVDATARNIAIARRHASQSSLDIDYRHGLTGTLVQGEERFDVVLNLEVVEHVADPEKLLQECAVLVKPGGLLIVATLNRTVRSFLLAIVGAEYVLNWLPKGTHRWSRFMRPNEIRGITETRGLDVSDVTGVSYNPVTDRWRLSTDTSVNYLLLAHKNL